MSADPLSRLQPLLKLGLRMGASDVHLKTDAPMMLRISGELYTVESEVVSEEDLTSVADAMLPSHARDKFERLMEADFSFVCEGVGRFRANVFMQKGKVCIAMRHVKTDIPTFEDLHLPLQLKEIAMAPRGIVIVSGTTGCGKSTTLAAMIEHINETQKRHIITVEDPIEYLFLDRASVIEQREVGLDTMSFEAALTHILRQDPDVIMIGEMRDAASFMAALTAADTGHLVLTTLHTTTASQAVTRILDFFPHQEREQIRMSLAFTLRAVACQRLVPGADAEGVVPAVEIMINGPTVRKLIEENRLEKLWAAIETGREDGMQTFNQALYDLVQQGMVTEADALARATNPEALRMNLQGIFLDESRRILST